MNLQKSTDNIKEEENLYVDCIYNYWTGLQGRETCEYGWIQCLEKACPNYTPAKKPFNSKLMDNEANKEFTDQKNSEKMYSYSAPCKPGQTVWSAEPFTDGRVRSGGIVQIEFDEDGFCGFWVSFDPEPCSAEFIDEDIGKKVFFNEEEAIKILSNKEAKDDGSAD